MSLRQLMVAKDISEALQVKAFLEAQGIEVTIPDAHFNTMYSNFTGSRLIIKESDYDKAIHLLRQIHISPASVNASGQVTNEGLKKLNRALGASLLGIMAIPVIPTFYSLFLLFKSPRYINHKFFITLGINVSALALYGTIFVSYFL